MCCSVCILTSLAASAVANWNNEPLFFSGTLADRAKQLVLKQMPPPEYVKAASEGAVTVMHAFVKVINGCQQVMTLSLHQPMIDSVSA
jgi:hypothetical protein